MHERTAIRTDLLWTPLLLLGALGTAIIGAFWITGDHSTEVTFSLLGLLGATFALAVLVNWRAGVYSLLVWLAIEDLIRKFSGNNMLIFFSKEIMVGVTYVAFFVALRLRRVETFRPPFLTPFLIFLFFGVVQMFNPGSPSLLFGVLGIKIYFYYVPLMFLAYALIDSPAALRNFLRCTCLLGLVVGLLGIAQGILGLSFLNPTDLPEELALAKLSRYAPTSGLVMPRLSSVFASGGRFAVFMYSVFLLAMGSLLGSFLRRGLDRLLIGATTVVTAMALFMSGARAMVIFTVGTTAMFGLLLLRRSRLHQRYVQSNGFIKLLFILVAIAIIGLTVLSDVLMAPLAFYRETLSPFSDTSQLYQGAVGYPIGEFKKAFTGNWMLGYGIGTASLGVQYVVQMFSVPSLGGWVESGYGNLIVEMGILAPILWVWWSITMAKSGWAVVSRLQGSPYFALSFGVWWFPVWLVILKVYTGLAAYQNYLNNIYMWVFLGILFRLPALAARKREGHVVRR